MSVVAQDILRIFAHIPLFDESPTLTPVVEATPTPVVEPTPVPAAAPSPWSPDQWLRTTGWSADFHTPFLVLFLFIAVAAVVVYFYLFQRRFRTHSLHARLAERVSMILTGVAALGLLLLLVALAKVPLLSAPIWLILTMVGIIALIIYAIYYYVSFYPAALARYEREQERARYLPKGKTKGPAYTPPMKKRKQAKPKKK